MDYKFETFQLYLDIFQQIKHKAECEYLVIGGDFNFDLESFEKNREEILAEFDLMVVPYKHQRGLRLSEDQQITGALSSKVDGLICSKDLCNTPIDVVVYHNFDEETIRTLNATEANNGSNTRFVGSGVSDKILDHDPILFTITIPKKIEAEDDSRNHLSLSTTPTRSTEAVAGASQERVSGQDHDNSNEGASSSSSLTLVTGVALDENFASLSLKDKKDERETGEKPQKG